jgi:hypothetical protein
MVEHIGELHGAFLEKSIPGRINSYLNNCFDAQLTCMSQGDSQAGALQ